MSSRLADHFLVRESLAHHPAAEAMTALYVAACLADFDFTN